MKGAMTIDVVGAGQGMIAKLPLGWRMTCLISVANESLSTTAKEMALFGISAVDGHSKPEFM